MKSKSYDALAGEALVLLRNTLSNGESADGAIPAGADLEELFIAELEDRRRRLERWMQLLRAEAGYENEVLCAPGAAHRLSRHRCKGRMHRQPS